MIRLTDVSKYYRSNQNVTLGLHKINLEFHPGEFAVITGESGSGKSTLLNILGILDTYDTGTYTLNGQLIRNLSETRAAELRNRMIGFIFQSFNLISFIFSASI